ncbi:MAG: hypothetical protein ACREC0_09120 [Methylocella sp.]
MEMPVIWRFVAQEVQNGAPGIVEFDVAFVVGGIFMHPPMIAG